MTTSSQALLAALASLSLLVGGVACGDKDGGGGDGGADSGDDGGATDGGADGGGDGGTGGDAGTSEGDPRDGTYRGLFQVRIIQPKGEVVDTCVGQSNLRVALDATQHVMGTGTCHFEGALADTFSEAYSANITGMNDKGENLSGAFDIAFGGGTIIADDWTGSFRPEQKMQGAFNGTVTISGTTYDYTGGFDAQLVPEKGPGDGGAGDGGGT